MATGEWQLVIGNWQMATGKWQLVNGNWAMAAGYWQLVNGNWLLATAISLFSPHKNTFLVRIENVELKNQMKEKTDLR